MREKAPLTISSETGDGHTAQHQAYLSASEAVPFLVCFWMLDLSDFLECLWNEMLKKYKYMMNRATVISYNDKSNRHENDNYLLYMVLSAF